MIENLSMITIMNTELLQLIKEILVILIGVFLGTFLAYRFSEKQKGKKEHFKDLKERIFKPWRAELERGLDHEYEYQANYFHAKSWVMCLLEGVVENIFLKERWLFEECIRGRKHPNIDILPKWKKIVDKLKEHIDKRESFFAELESQLLERMQLPIRNGHNANDKYITETFINAFCAELICEVIGDECIVRYPGIKLKIKEVEGSGSSGNYELYFGKGHDAVAKGTKEEMEKCKSIFHEIRKKENKYREKAEKILSSENKIGKELENFKKELDWIIDTKKTLKGKCSYL